MGFSLLSLGLALFGRPAQAPGPQGLAPDLAPPVKILAAGKPIDVDTGHAAPFVADFDGDGVRDLLVGQFRDGKLRIYHNGGSNTEPRFDRFAWFLDGRPEGRVPAS